MKTNKVGYDKKYLKDAADMMSKTWTYHNSLQGNYDLEYFYSLFLEFSNIDFSYTEFLTNEKDQLVAILIATPTKVKISKKILSVCFKSLFGLLTGKFGNRLNAIKVLDILLKDGETLMKDKEMYDEELSLFFIDESCRGYGVGKQLMNNYIEYCKNNNVKNVILLTDAGCNYGFYDHYGFLRINQIHSDYFAHTEMEYNGYAYAYEVNKI